MKTYRVGLVGFGFIGKVHAYGHLNIPLFYENPPFCSKITHVCTSHPETAEKAAAFTGAEHAVTDYHAITENPDIDIVDICTPNDNHAEILLSAMANGKHIYCDKPLTGNLEQALQVQESMKTWQGMGQMTLQNRFYPASMRAKQMMEEGRLGRILEFRGDFLHSGNADPNAPLRWKLQAGTIADLGSHVIDMMTWLLGPFASLTAASYTAYTERTDVHGKSGTVSGDDSFSMIARLPSGALGTVRASKIATGAQDCLGFEINGSKGALRWNPMNLEQLFYYDNTAVAAPYGGLRGWTAIDCAQRYEKPAGFPTQRAPVDWIRGHVHCLYTFLKSLYDGRQYGPSLQEGVELQKVLAKVYESAESGRWVEL